MRCPECGEASNARLRYCENCGAKMPEAPVQKTGPRPAARPSRPGRTSSEPAYAAEILEEVEEYSRPHAVGDAPPLSPEDKTDPGLAAAAGPAYDGPKWLASVPAHSPSVAGVGLLGVALVLSILPFFSGAGVPGTLLALVAGGVLVARELREAGEAPGFTEQVPEVLLRPEAAALSTVVLAAVAVRMLGLGLLPLLWLVGAGLVVHDQWRKVLSGPEGLAATWFEPRQLLRMPDVVALAGVALCLLMMFAPWAQVSTRTDPALDNAPRPQGPPELRVAPSTRPSDDVLYSNGAGVVSLSGWDLPASVVVELALLGLLAVMALRPEVERPDWLRFVPVGLAGFGLIWALANIRLAAGPMLFLVSVAAVGLLAARQAFVAGPALEQSADDPTEEDEYSYDEEQQ